MSKVVKAGFFLFSTLLFVGILKAQISPCVDSNEARQISVAFHGQRHLPLNARLLFSCDLFYDDDDDDGVNEIDHPACIPAQNVETWCGCSREVEQATHTRRARVTGALSFRTAPKQGPPTCSGDRNTSVSLT
jgi:hypothetical protein